MAYGSKGAGRTLNMAKLGGSKAKLKMAGDMRPAYQVGATFKKARKSGPHKKV